jgi:hypothetical protein
MNKTLMEVLEEAYHQVGAAVVVPSLRALSESTRLYIRSHKLMVLGAYDSSNAHTGAAFKEDIPEMDVFRAAAYDVQVLHVWNVLYEHKAIQYMRARLRCSDPAAVTFEIRLYSPRPDLSDIKPDGK